MSIGRRLKQPRGKDPKATRTPRSTNKRSKEARAEELSPEQRVEFAQQIEAKEFRGRPAPRRRRGRVRAYSASEYRGSAARHAASGSPISLRTMFVPSTIATILYCAWRRLMPSRPIPQSEEITIRSGGMCFSASRTMSATWSLGPPYGGRRFRDRPVRPLRHFPTAAETDFFTRGTEGSNPACSSGESRANLTSSTPPRPTAI